MARFYLGLGFCLSLNDRRGEWGGALTPNGGTVDDHRLQLTLPYSLWWLFPSTALPPSGGGDASVLEA